MNLTLLTRQIIPSRQQYHRNINCTSSLAIEYFKNTNNIIFNSHHQQQQQQQQQHQQYQPVNQVISSSPLCRLLHHNNHQKQLLITTAFYYQNCYRYYTSNKSQSNFVLKQSISEILIKNQQEINKMSSKPKVVFVLGAPGAGKGTQCQKIVDEFEYVHLSAGDLLREERQRAGSEFGELIENCIVNGSIVPVEVTCSLLENAMNKCISETGKNKFLIDGFPRNKDNLDGWTKQMSEKVNLQFVLVFDCTEDVCVERCLSRGAAGSGRTDDNMESLKKRFNTFFCDSLPIIEHYNTMHLVRKIDGSPAAESVFDKVKNVFNEIGSSTDDENSEKK